ncbi:phage tail assembly chaperone [Comamonas terrigena]|uniref:phage tail assembly chaperone n=1 Tax=Comamonas terrigena TaxID=32013 RepID=UPI0028AEF3E9|nr:phage tail assembly chaperone [Comamonas terrigena]
MTVVLSKVAFWAPVTFTRVGDDGKPETLEFRARYKHLKKSVRLDLDRRLQAIHLNAEVRKDLVQRMEDPATPEYQRKEIRLMLDAKQITDAEFLNEVLCDWELKGSDGQFIPYTEAARAELEEELDGLEIALFRAYQKARQNAAAPAAVEKNSEQPSATTS